MAGNRFQPAMRDVERDAAVRFEIVEAQLFKRPRQNIDIPRLRRAQRGRGAEVRTDRGQQRQPRRREDQDEEDEVGHGNQRTEDRGQ